MGDFVLRSMVKAKRVYSFERHEYVVPVYDIDNIPSQNVKMIVKGKWGKDGDCSVCGCQPWYERDIHTLNYCPNCGARMEE